MKLVSSQRQETFDDHSRKTLYFIDWNAVRSTNYRVWGFGSVRKVPHRVLSRETVYVCMFVHLSSETRRQEGVWAFLEKQIT